MAVWHAAHYGQQSKYSLLIFKCLLSSNIAEGERSERYISETVLSPVELSLLRSFRLQLPPGFVASKYSPATLPDARSLALSRGDNGGATIVYVGTREKREVG